MIGAWLLCAAAIAGGALGTSERSRTPSALLSAAAGGLLAAMCLFFLLPEIAEQIGRGSAIALVFGIAAALFLIDRSLIHNGAVRSGKAVLMTLLIATAIHSFLDGWSVRALAPEALKHSAALLGLALHKIPEGIAIGWVLRRRLGTRMSALGLTTLMELATPLGAWLEPAVAASGRSIFGPGWQAFVIAIVGGTFLFLGIHAIGDERRNVKALVVFLLSFALMGAVAAYPGLG